MLKRDWPRNVMICVIVTFVFLTLGRLYLFLTEEPEHLGSLVHTQEVVGIGDGRTTTFRASRFIVVESGVFVDGKAVNSRDYKIRINGTLKLSFTPGEDQKVTIDYWYEPQVSRNTKWR